MNLLYLAVAGLIVGLFGGRFMKGGGFGLLGDIILGVIGGVFGGWASASLGAWTGGGIVPALIAGTVTAVALLLLVRRLLKGKGLGEKKSGPVSDPRPGTV